MLHCVLRRTNGMCLAALGARIVVLLLCLSPEVEPPVLHIWAIAQNNNCNWCKGDKTNVVWYQRTRSSTSPSSADQCRLYGMSG